MAESKHTPGPWEHVAATEHHGHYVVSLYGSTVCDLYAMSDPSSLSVRNGGTSRPIPFIADDAEANARLIAAAPDYHRQTEQNIGALELLRIALQAGDPLRELLFRVDDLLRENRALQAKAEGN